MKGLFIIIMVISNFAFAYSISCQSLDENVGGGNIQIGIFPDTKNLDYNVNVSNISKNSTIAFLGTGYAASSTIDLTLHSGSGANLAVVGTIVAERGSDGVLTGTVTNSELEISTEKVVCEVKL